MDMIWQVVIFGPVLAPLGSFLIGCLMCRAPFASRRWLPIAWYYGSLGVVITIGVAVGLIGKPFTWDMLDFLGVFILLWFVFWVFGFALGAGFLLAQLRREGTITRICRGCRYDLTGNTSGICPECGKAISREQMELLAQGYLGEGPTSPSKR